MSIYMFVYLFIYLPFVYKATLESYPLGLFDIYWCLTCLELGATSTLINGFAFPGTVSQHQLTGIHSHSATPVNRGW